MGDYQTAKAVYEHYKKTLPFVGPMKKDKSGKEAFYFYTETEDKPTPVVTVTETKKGPGPNGETIKAKTNVKGEKIYHLPGGDFYERLNPEAWFFTEEEAQVVGYRRSKR